MTANVRRLPVSVLVVTVGVLYFAREVLIPLALALLFSFLLGPLVRRLERWKMSRVFAVLAVTAIFFCAFGLLGWVMAHQIIDLAAKAPSYKDNIQRKFDSLGRQGGTLTTAAKVVSDIQKHSTDDAASPAPASRPSTREETAASEIVKATGSDKPPIDVRVVEPPANPPQFLRNVLGPLLAPLGMAGIVIIFTVFMLIGREDLRDRLLHLAGPERLPTTTQMVDDAGKRVSRYLQMQVAVNVGFGLAVTVGLYFIKVPNAALWGLLAAILRFVPYIGPWLGAAFPVVLAGAAFDSWTPVLLTFGLFVLIELTIANAIEPWLYGSSTGLSPVALIVAATFWTWLWGGVGLLLSTPLTVCIVVLGRYVPQLAFLHTLLGDEPVLPPDSRLYQRLLAFDQEEAAEQVEEFLKEHPVMELYDAVLIPALNQVQLDARNGDLDDSRQQFIRQTFHEIIDDQRERPAAGGAKAPASSRAPVLILPARNEGDELAGQMLAHLLTLGGVKAEALSHKALFNEMVETVAERQAGLVCLSTLRPFAVMQARHFAKRLRAQFPQIKIIVGLWDPKKPGASAKQNVEAAPVDWVVSTLAEAVHQLCQEAPCVPCGQLGSPLLGGADEAEKTQPLVPAMG